MNTHYRVLEAIRGYQRMHGGTPSHRELMELCGMTSTSHVSFCLDKLEAEGLLRRSKSADGRKIARGRRNSGRDSSLRSE